jgi:hypothetical protein
LACSRSSAGGCARSPASPLGDSISHVAFTPDGRRALAVHHDSAKLSLLRVAGDKVTFDGIQVTTTPGVYVAEATPDGRLALTIDKEFVTFVDLTSERPHAIAQVPVSAGGEGLAISPRGDVAVSISLRASNGDKRSPQFHERGAIDVLRIEGDEGQPCEDDRGRSHSRSGGVHARRALSLRRQLLDEVVWIFRVNGSEVTDTGKRITLPGRPASGRTTPGKPLGAGAVQ